MTQVLRVSQYGIGEFVYLDKDGSVIDPTVESTVLTTEDADVLMERIVQGYQHIPVGHYILRLDETGSSTVHHAEFTELVLFGIDEDGYPVPNHLRLIPKNEYDRPTTEHSTILTKVAFVDYEQQRISWLFNPLLSNPVCINPNDAPVSSEINEDTSAIISAATRKHMRGMPLHVSPITVRFYKG